MQRDTDLGQRCRERYRPVFCNDIEDGQASTHLIQIGEPSFYRKMPPSFGDRLTTEQLVMVIYEDDMPATPNSEQLVVTLSACPGKDTSGLNHVPGWLNVFKICPYGTGVNATLELVASQADPPECPHVQVTVEAAGTYWLELTTYDASQLHLTTECSIQSKSADDGCDGVGLLCFESNTETTMIFGIVVLVTGMALPSFRSSRKKRVRETPTAAAVAARSTVLADGAVDANDARL